MSGRRDVRVAGAGGRDVCTVVVNRRQTSIQLASEPSAVRSASVNDLRFEFVQLDPYPFSARPTQPSDYRLSVRVVR